VKLPGFVRSAAQRVLADFYLGDARRRQEVGALLDRLSPRGLLKELVAQIQFRAGSETSWVTPRGVRFELTSRCNLKCVMCPQPETMQRPREDLDFDRYRRFLDANPGLEEVDLFNWGEPLLHPRVFDFVAYASSRGLYTRLVTNAVLLDARRAEGLIRAGLRAIYFSFDGLGEDFKRIRGVPIERPLANVKAFLEMRDRLGAPVFTGINVTLSAWNRDSAERTARELRASLGVDAVEVQPGEEYSPSYARKVACFEPYRYAVVLSDTRIVPCCVDFDGKLAFGSIAEETDLRRLYNSPAMRRLRASLRDPATMPKLCSSCTFKIPASERPPHQRLGPAQPAPRAAARDAAERDACA
jgi:MoaA/NifB/PqqE/SkfB family radical SAM enzyme